MTEQQFEELAKRWPDLFQKSGDFELSVGDGWYNIIDTLCGFLSRNVERAKSRLQYALDNPTAKMEPIEKLEAIVAHELKELAIISQVKEKFGTLRFYMDNATTEQYAYAEFAEAMSRHTCEICGSPGEARNNGWVKVLCDKHHKEREEKNAAALTAQGPMVARLSDEHNIDPE
jgi:hypothetical protein